MWGEFRKNLAFRLTFLHSVLFGIAFVLVFSVIYLWVGYVLLKNTDVDLLDDTKDFEEANAGGGMAGLVAYIDAEIEDNGPANMFLRAMRTDGNILYVSDNTQWGDIPPLQAPSDPRVPAFRSFAIPERPGLSARSITFYVGDILMELAVPIEWEAGFMAELRHAFSIGVAFTLILAVSIGWFMANRSLSGMKEIEKVARSIAGSTDLGKRVPLKGSGDELDSLAATFNLMLGRIESSVRELSDMMDNIAHDLKTPLARIRVMAETGIEGRDVEDARGSLVQIMDEVDRFHAILNAILDISEARTGLLQLVTAKVDVRDLLDDAEKLFADAAKAQAIHFHVSPPVDPMPIEVDRGRIMQALLNILDNAFKFTPAGGAVFLRAWVGEGLAHICVSDTGVGIPKGEISKIFERFYRSDRSRSGAGRGIGLSLARAFVEAHGGSITVESEVGRGSTFCIRLPIEYATG